MKNLGMACVLALCLACGAAIGAPPGGTTAAPVEPQMRFYRQRIAEAHALHGADRHEEARRALDALLPDPLFASLEKDEQRALLSAAAWSHARQDDLEGASALYGRTTALGLNDPDDWYRLALVTSDLERYDQAAHALTQLVQLHPELLPNIAPEIPHRVVREGEPDSEARLGLMQALFDANWRDAGGSVVWYQLALRRMIRGEHELARGPIRRVSNPMDLVRLRSDRRFDAFVERDAWAFNVAAAAERHVQELREKAEADPASLDARIQLGYALLTAGKHEEMLAMVDAAIDRIAVADPANPAFKDMGDQVWLLDHRARALRRLGRHDEALAELTRATRLTEDGTGNTSQVLNLGYFHCGMKQPRQALDAIAGVGMMSDYGRTVQTGVRLCAALQLDDAAMVEHELAYLREHRDDSEINYLEALLAADRQDDAAAYLIELLASPDLRAEALEWMQEYAQSHPLPLDVEYFKTRTRLLARDDVRAALDLVGRVETYSIHGSIGIL